MEGATASSPSHPTRKSNGGVKMKKALIVALALLLIGLTAWGALDKNDYKGGVFWTDRHNAVIGGITSTGYFEPLLGLNFLDDIVLSFGGTAGGTAGPFTMEWTTADPNANCFLFDMPTGGVVDVPVFMIASADSDFGYFNGTVEPTLAIENLVGTSWISLDHSATTLARLQAGGAATYLTIQTELAGSDIVLDAADAAAGTAQQYVSITGTTPIHASGTPTDIFLDVTPTISANTATATVHLVDLSFSTPVWVTGAATSTVSGVYLAPTIGAATAGTNTVNMIEIANYTGDADVNVTGISIGTSDGLGTANAIAIGAGWDEGITSASSVALTGANADLDVEDNITCGDLVIDEAAGVLDFSGGTTATISTSSADTPLILDVADAAAGASMNYVEIPASIPAHASATPTTRLLTLDPTIAIPTVENTVNLIDMVFTTPVYGTACTSTIRGLYFDPTIGAATAGTNNLVLFDVAAIGDSDDNLNIYGIRMGAMTGAGGTENAIDIGAGWDWAFTSTSPVALTGADGDLDVEDNGTFGDIVIDEASGVLDFTGATDGRIETSTVGAEIVLDAFDATTGLDKSYVQIEGSVPIHDAATPTSIFLDINPTVGVPTVANTVNLIDMTFTTPIYATACASTYRGLYFAPTIGAATAGTNQVNMIEIENYTGDAEVNVTGIDIGTSDGLGTAYGISVGAGWDAGLTMASPVVITIPAGGTDLETALDIDVTSSTIEANNYGIDLDVTQGSIVDDVYLSRGNLQGVRSDCVAIGNIDHVYAMRSGASIAMTADSETNQFYGGTFSAAASGAFTLTLHDGLVGFQSTVTVDSGVTDVTGGLVAAGFFNSEPIGKDITSPTYTLYLKSGGYTDFGQSIQVESNNLTAAMRIQATDSAVLPIGLQFSTQTASITNDIELSSGQFISGGTDGVPSAAGASAVEYAAGCFKTVITVDATGANDLDLEDKADGDGVLLYTFPVGHIRILGVTADLEATSSTGIDQNTFPMALGTAPGTDNTATLTGTQDDLSASQAISYDGTQDVDCPPAAAANYDGTSSAVVVYLNAAVADADISSTSTVEATGTVTIHWMNLGDY